MKLKFAAGILLACLMILTISCQMDDNITKETHKHSIVRESRLTLQDLEALPNAIKIINRINGHSSDPKKKNVYNEDYDFFVNTDNILRIDNGNYHSLTFPVFRFEDNGYTENLVLSEDDNGDYTAYLYTYDLTLQEKSAVADGKPTLITNKIKREKINFDSSQVTQRMIQIWYTEVIVISCGDNNYHNATNFGLWHQCIEEKQPQVLVITRSVTIDDGDSGWIEGGNYSGGSSSGGGTPTYNPNIPPFDPDKEMGLVKGNITKPLVLQGTPEQNFYNNDLGGDNTDLRFVMNNSIVRIPILQYLQQNGYSSQSRNVAVEMLKTIADGGEVDIPNRVLLDPSFTENPCLNGIYTDLGKAPTFQNYLNNFDGDFSVADLKLSAGNDMPNTVDAITYPPLTSNLIEIKFNLNNLNKPGLEIAETMIHEMIHATIFRWLLIAAETGELEPEGGMTQQQLINYVNNLRDNFPGLYDYYYQRKLPDWDHEMMAAHFIDIIKQALKDYDSTQSEEVYEALAWGGLKNTSSWNALSPQQQANLTTIRQNFLNNNTNCD